MQFPGTGHNYNEEINLDTLFVDDNSDIQIKFLENTYRLLQTERYYSVGVKYLCFACDNWEHCIKYADLLLECIKSSRIYLYSDMLEKRGLNIDDDFSYIDLAQKAFYQITPETTLTREQKKLFRFFQKNRKIVVSAPTSFGKSKVISEIIANNKYAAIAIVVPTNSLLQETYYNIKSEKSLSNYDLIYSTSANPQVTPTIYIFTPEKFDVYTDEYNIVFDLFIFDEIYKVSSADSRSSVFTRCLYKAYQQKCDYYLIGPYFNQFSEAFLDKTGGVFTKFSTEIVQKDVYNFFEKKAINIDGKKIRYTKTKEIRLKNILATIDGQSIVYISTKRSAEAKACQCQ